MLDAHMNDVHIWPMTLHEYLSHMGITETAFGHLAGISQSQVNRLRHGKSWPQRDVAERIKAATGGKVTPDDFLPAREPEAAA